MYIRHDYKTNIAGDSILLMKTKEYLEKLEVSVDISSNSNENLQEYHLIHLFNTIRILDTYKFFKNVERYKKKVVLTPIYWNYMSYIPYSYKTAAKISYWKSQDSLRREVFQKVDMILPGSEIEMKEIEKKFKIKKLYRIIPNGVDKIFAFKKEIDFSKKINISDFVLSVGRICPHKNQLSLAKATKNLDIPLVLIGAINDWNYYCQCMKVNRNIIYINEIHHDLLVSAYNAAKVHALVSWYEIPGLVNLEAGLAGCKVITTGEGSTKEYFQNHVEYVDPYDIVDIEKN